MTNYEKSLFVCVVTLMSILIALGFITAESVSDVLMVPTMCLITSFIPALCKIAIFDIELATAPFIALGGVCVGIALVGGAVGAVVGVLVSMAIAVYFIVA